MTSKNLSRRAFVAASGLGAGALALSACGCSGNVKPISLVLDYAPNVNHTGIYVALSKGYFANEKVDVEILPVPEDGSDALIGSGGADMGFTYQDYLANNLTSDAPMPYTAVAAVVQHNTSGIMSRMEDGIKTPKGLENHKYATWNLPIEQATIKQIVEADGGDFSKVKMVPYTVDDEVIGLRGNLFDAVWVYKWWAVQNAKLQGYSVNYFGFADVDPVFDYYTPVLAVNDAFAAENPEKVKAFLRAAKRGYEFAAENPDEAAAILCNAVPELDKGLAKAAQESISAEYISDADSWGVIDPTRWAKFYQWLNDKKLVAHELDVNAGFTMDYLS